MISRERIYDVLTSKKEGDRAATIYNFIMVILIILWMVPLWFKEEHFSFPIIDSFCTGVFIVDYLLRWATADFKLNRGKISFVLYPFTPMAILDLLSFVPSFLTANASFKAIRIIRFLGALRAFKLVRHSRSIRMLLDAARSQSMPLLVAFVLSAIYVLASATVMFNVEPDTFDTFLDALYWSVISLTTIGYGDIHPMTEIGRIVAMLSAIVGVAIIAFPSGIIAAGMINELGKRDWEELASRITRNGRKGQPSGTEGTTRTDETNEAGGPDEADPPRGPSRST